MGAAEENSSVDKEKYQGLVEKLIDLSHTRPDIGFSVSVVSQFMNNPREKHLEAVYRILKYLKMTPGKRLLPDNRDISIYTDADWVGSPTNKRSTSGYCSMFGNI